MNQWAWLSLGKERSRTVERDKVLFHTVHLSPFSPAPMGRTTACLPDKLPIPVMLIQKRKSFFEKLPQILLAPEGYSR